MADYIYTMESRLSLEQMRAVNTVQSIARSHGMNLYLTGGAIRDILTGFPIRDLDFTVQGNALDLQSDIETAGGIVDMVDPAFCVIHAIFEGTAVEIGMARAELFDKAGKPPLVTPATLNEDLRRRDFTFNAMALSLNDGSRGLLLDPFNGAADIDARLIRVLHSYAFLEDPSRMIRATRFATRFGYEFEERTRARYDAAREGEYIQFISSSAIGYEIEQIAHEENPIAVLRALEEQGWLQVLWPKWTVAKADVPELNQLLTTRSIMAELNIGVNSAPAVMHFVTMKLKDTEVRAIQQLIPHREFLAAWKRLEHDAKELSKKLLSKEASLNSGAWKILSSAKPEALLYLDVTGSNKAVDEKIKNYLGKWRQFQEKIPLAQMAELRITPQLPEYASISQEAFLMLLDGKLRSDAEIAKFLAPFEPPPPPPPPTPVRRGRGTAKKPPSSAAKTGGQQTPTPVPAVVQTITANGPAEDPKAVSTAKSSKQKKPAEKNLTKPAAVSRSSAKTSVSAKVAAKPAQKAPIAKSASKKAAKPAPKMVKPSSSASRRGKQSEKKTAKKLVKHAPEKSKHRPKGHARDHKSGKKR